MTAAAAGVCRYCLCTEDNACRTPPCGEPCCWVDSARTVCSNWPCMARYRMEQKIQTPRAKPGFRIDESAGRVRRYGRKKKKGGKAA